MPKYDFHNILEPLEFEALVCDIVRTRDKIELETYKEGRDMGIDGSYIKKGEKVIVQAKRYKDYKSLKYQLKNNELPKVRKLNPTRYILGISMVFSPEQKNEIKDLFEGYILDTSDIISANNINDLLKDKKYKQVERNYPKLWMPSANVLSKILTESAHKPIYKESSQELKEAFRTTDFFVPTRIYRQALSKWEKNNVIILSGEPGVGKTTMARLLALVILHPNNFEGFIWVNSIDDVYRVLEEEQKQVIIFDDFWGSIFYEEHSSRKTENRLNQLIRNIINMKGEKRLILTTREYVLQQGLQKHPLLRETLEKYSLICMMEEYGYDEKASILFQHLYHSQLDYEFLWYVFMKSNQIIYHKNYNPRVLALFLDKELKKDSSPADYHDELLSYLDNPEDFWKEVFIDLSTEARILSLLLLISTTAIRINDINLCYQKFIHTSNNPLMTKNFSDCIKELEKSVIKTFYSDEEDTILIKFSVPAVQDFLYKFISENTEQFIPLILKCCAYFNQLQFLLEHYSKYCSKFVDGLIIQECITRYSEYVDCYLEYNDDMDVDFAKNGEELHRFFDLLRICDPNNQIELFNFLETVIKGYCSTMGKGDLDAQYIDLQNLPDIIARCVNKGMIFNGENIIRDFYAQAFSAFHFKFMKEFQEVFPEDYNAFKKTHYNDLKRNLKNIVLDEIEFLVEECRYYELDLLVDDIPNLLKEFGLRFTEKFGNQIYEICGRKPISVNKQNIEFNTPLEDYVDREELDLEVIKDDAKRWLFGPKEIYIEENQVGELILNSGLNGVIIEELMRINESGTPRFIYNMLDTEESYNMLIQVIKNNNINEIPEKESYLSMMILYEISGKDKMRLAKLLNFCAECTFLIMYKEEPILRINNFLSSEIYEFYLKDDPELREIVFDNLILKDEQWIRFIHVHVFIFCHAFIISQHFDEDELEKYYIDLWGNNFIKLKHVTKYNKITRTSVGYVDFGTYYFKNYYWEGSMYRMVEELMPFHFNKHYTESKLEDYLNSLGKDGDDIKVMNHISSCKYQLEYNESAELCGHSSLLNDELSLIEHLNIAEEPYFDEVNIDVERLQKLQETEGFCIKKEGIWKLNLYEIKDMELLKELGFYDEILSFIKKVENVHSRFSNGVYLIKR